MGLFDLDSLSAHAEVNGRVRRVTFTAGRLTIGDGELRLDDALTILSSLESGSLRTVSTEALTARRSTPDDRRGDAWEDALRFPPPAVQPPAPAQGAPLLVHGPQVAPVVVVPPVQVAPPAEPPSAPSVVPAPVVVAPAVPPPVVQPPARVAPWEDPPAAAPQEPAQGAPAAQPPTAQPAPVAPPAEPPSAPTGDSSAELPGEVVKAQTLRPVIGYLHDTRGVRGLEAMLGAVKDLRTRVKLVETVLAGGEGALRTRLERTMTALQLTL